MKIKIRPIYFAIIITLFSLIFVYEAVSCVSLSYNLPFVGYGGTFRYNNMAILGVPVYWVMMLAGFVTTLVISIKRSIQFSIRKTQAVILPILFLLISFVCAKILYVIQTYNPDQKFVLEMSGLSLFGAIFGILAFSPIVSLAFRIKIGKLLDFFTPFGLVLLSFVRTGCFLNGCCGSFVIWDNTNPIILPVQLFEVVLDLIVLEVCFNIEKKSKNTGYSYPIFMFLYGICRFILEFMRDSEVVLWGLSEGQILSVFSVVISVTILLYLNAKYSKNKSNR